MEVKEVISASRYVIRNKHWKYKQIKLRKRNSLYNWADIPSVKSKTVAALDPHARHFS
jgi:hypothetical protein